MIEDTKVRRKSVKFQKHTHGQMTNPREEIKQAIEKFHKKEQMKQKE